VRRKQLAPRGATLIDPETQVWRPVFGFDIDGTLGEYHKHFVNFANEWLGCWPRRSYDMYDGSCSLAEFMGVSKDTYRKMKLAYRRGGMKRSMPEDRMMIETANVLRQQGAEIIICTTRPYLSLENIDIDTRHWLKRNGVKHDGVIWGEHKYRELAKARPNRVLAVIDDLPELVAQAESVGIPGMMIARHHNMAWRSEHSTFDDDLDWTHILDACEGMLNKWKKENL
jgi:hypothetical protein